MRVVQITIGVPEGSADEIGIPDKDPMADCYCVNFTDEEDDHALIAQCACLCHLHDATEAWLTGSTDEQIRSIMSEHEDGCDHIDPDIT